MITKDLIDAIKANKIITTILHKELKEHAMCVEDIKHLLVEGLSAEAVFIYRELNKCSITDAHKAVQSLKKHLVI